MTLQTPPAPSVADQELEAGVIEDARRRQRRHRRVAGALITVAAIAGGLIAGLAGGGGSGSGHGIRPAHPPGGTPPPPVSHLSQVAVRADAIGEARALLGSARLPAGVVRIGHIRVPVQGMVGARRKIQVHGNTADASALWLSPASMAQTVAYVKAHAPAGATKSSYGSGGPLGRISDMVVDYKWPLVADKRGIRDLTGYLAVMVMRLSDRRAVVQVASQATGLQPRPTSEAIPPGVKAVSVRLQTPPNTVDGHRLGPLLREMIITPVGIRQAVQLVDSIAITQTSTTRCPARGPADGTLTVTYTSGATAPALAQASVKLPPGWVEGGALAFAAGSSCDPIDFSIHGQPQTPLAGPGAGQFMASIIKLAGFMPRLTRLAARTLGTLESAARGAV